MSGGHFDYAQYKIAEIADEVSRLIENNDDKSLNEWGSPRGHGFSEETIQEFKRAIVFLKLAEMYAQRIDWLVSGDDGEDSFHRRIKEDTTELSTSIKESNREINVLIAAATKAVNSYFLGDNLNEMKELKRIIDAYKKSKEDKPTPSECYPIARGCSVCGIGSDGKVYGYVCTRGDCLTRITCGAPYFE